MAKTTADIRSLAREHTALCIRTLAHIVRSPKAPEGARVVAANSLLDRGWGKAEQVHAGPDGGPIRVIIRQVIDNVEEDQPLVIEQVPARIKG
jgi:hypothetical protein